MACGDGEVDAGDLGPQPEALTEAPGQPSVDGAAGKREALQRHSGAVCAGHTDNNCSVTAHPTDCDAHLPTKDTWGPRIARCGDKLG